MMNSIKLYWWSERYIQNKQKENYGDLLGAYLVEKITGKSVQFYRNTKRPWWRKSRPYLSTVGSIISHLDDKATVWGSGIINRQDPIPTATYLAVRGPLSRKRILEENIHCPEVYGDPALLLPLYFNPKVEKKYKLGVIPHINDLERVHSFVAKDKSMHIIDFNTNDVEHTTREILSCSSIISSSLHGVIVAHAYHIPAVQVRFTDRIFGDGVKYQDYYESVGMNQEAIIEITDDLNVEKGTDIFKKKINTLPKATVIRDLQQGLLKVCPFKNVNHG